MNDTSYDVLSEVIEKRCSHRKFSDTAVPVETIEKLVDRARLAPSGHNIQPWEFVAVTNRDIIGGMGAAVEKGLKRTISVLPDDKVKELENFSFFITHFTEAPVVIAVSITKSEYLNKRIAREYGVPQPLDDLIDIDLLDAGAAIQNMLLAAHSLGLAACWMTAPLTYAQEDIDIILENQPGYKCISIVPVGWPTKERRGPSKKPLSEILRIIG